MRKVVCDEVCDKLLKEFDVEAVKMREDAKVKLRIAVQEYVKNVEFVMIVEEEDEEFLLWCVENIGEVQCLIEGGVVVFDIRFVKDFNRETFKGVTFMFAVICMGGLLDVVDNLVVDVMIDNINVDGKYVDKLFLVVVFYVVEVFEAYYLDVLRAFVEVFDDVVEVEGGFLFYFKYFIFVGKC